jgi:hypothetical protein
VSEDHKVYYISINAKPEGPLSLHEVRDLILIGKLKAQQMLYRDPEGHWQEAQSYPELKKEWFNRQMDPAMSADVKEEGPWILLIIDGDTKKQVGPLTTTEAQKSVAQAHATKQEVLAWQVGWPHWRPLEYLPLLMNSAGIDQSLLEQVHQIEI